MKKRMAFAIGLLVLVFGGVFGWNAMGKYFMNQYFATFEPPPATVSAAPAERQSWQPQIRAVGRLSAVRGVDLGNEVAGTVKEILFESGDTVEAGEVLVQLDDAIEQAELPGRVAQMELARLNVGRTQELIGRSLAAEEDLDRAKSELEQTQSAVASLRATIAKKQIRAPFSGTLGIRQVNLGEYLPPGTPIVTLQSLDELHVDFTLPEEFVDDVAPGQEVEVAVSAYPGQAFAGELGAVSVKVDPTSHNFDVQAVIDNREHRLRPGMFADVTVLAGHEEPVVAVPKTAISYSLHGDAVFVVEEAGPDDGDSASLVARQRFVRLGTSRGELVEVTEGIEPGERVVTAGVQKLRDGMAIQVNNEVALSAGSD
ncbi:MAG TPA: efflux RND transporter periplasmic adaptor subunit [Woeseiaceae bacterium]|nr:efflux RND transporter periplasmic adaptor subunit [Woeseiaceae bacterium]